MRTDFNTALQVLTKRMKRPLGSILVIIFVLAAFSGLVYGHKHRLVGIWKNADNQVVIEFLRDGRAKYGDDLCMWESKFPYSRYTFDCTSRTYDVSLLHGSMSVGNVSFERVP